MIEQDARMQLVQASSILAMQGIVDAFGHVSCRNSDRPDRFLMSRSKAPALVGEEDILEFDLDGTPVSEPEARVFLERFIHAEIYRARPDVQAVVHSHAHHVIGFTVVPKARIRPIWHMCGFLSSVGAPFDVADHAGAASDLLIRSPELGQRFAEHLGAGTVGLMRSHGYTAVGSSIAEAVFRAVYTARNCQIQSAALALGDPVYLTPGEAAACEVTIAGQADRAWNLWVHELDGMRGMPHVAHA
jgi:ribulose-5-phosphate 4-epimerase/fuculose-1-phosphate aldolase